ncbi:LytR/AlgR family response regulator transcription factor [Roseateles sp. BYS180W]|uniref:LytR/AlgR family response regulator transcription factor n=1 Tax=Roseateles rivi TaxID=3299028 RepID=A0ABW7FYY5_9BURK
MKTLLIEDSRLARLELRHLLREHPEVQLLGEAAALDEARQAIETLQPQLLLLDIHLDGGTAFELLDQLEHLPQVIFTTGFDNHAIEAFERNALDYLLKPVQPERLAQALSKAQAVLQAQTAAAPLAPETNEAAPPAAAPGTRKGLDDTIFVRDGERCWFVPLAEVSGFESYGNYARVYFREQRPLLARTLNHLEARLDPQAFFRASRSHIIGLRWISDIQPWLNDGYQVTLRDGRQVEVSRRQAKALRDMLEI